MHTSEDLPAATEYSSTLSYFPEGISQLGINIKALKTMKPSTQHAPCVDSHSQVCQDIKLYNLIKERYACHIEILFTGNHIPLDDNLQSCNTSIVFEGLKIRSEFQNECPSIVPCEFTRFELITENDDWLYDPPRHPNVLFKMISHIEVYQLSIQYTLASLIGEIGGTMGIFLGWSIIMIFETILHILKKRKLKVSFKKWVMIIPLLLLSVYWAKDSIMSFAYQAEKTEVQIKTGPLSLPSVTVCPYVAFESWMDLNYPCSQNESGFLTAVKKCLPTNPNMVNEIANQFLEDGPKSLTLLSEEESLIMDEKDIFKVFHSIHGVCYTFDTEKWQNKIRKCSLNYILEACSNWKLEVQFKQSSKIYKIFIHNTNDFPEASFIHPNFNMFSRPNWYFEVALRKKNTIKQSTISNPCPRHWPKTCLEIQKHEEIAKEYDCEIPIFYSGKHLTRKGLPDCPYGILMEILNRKYASHCSQTAPCEHISYEVVHENEMRVPEQPEAVFSIILKHEIEEHLHTDLSVDEQVW